MPETTTTAVTEAAVQSHENKAIDTLAAPVTTPVPSSIAADAAKAVAPAATATPTAPAAGPNVPATQPAVVKYMVMDDGSVYAVSGCRIDITGNPPKKLSYREELKADANNILLAAGVGLGVGLVGGVVGKMTYDRVTAPRT